MKTSHAKPRAGLGDMPCGYATKARVESPNLQKETSHIHTHTERERERETFF